MSNGTLARSVDRENLDLAVDYEKIVVVTRSGRALPRAWPASGIVRGPVSLKGMTTRALTT
jgi:hypothetical protein